MAEQNTASATEKKPNPFAAISSGSVKLKKTKVVKDKSGPQLTGYLTKQQIEEYDQYVKSFDIEAWYETLKDVTFPTEYVAISFEEAQTLYKFCEDIMKLNSSLGTADNADTKQQIAAEIKAKSSLAATELSDLCKRIDAAINKWKPGNDSNDENKNESENDSEFGVFAKLSSRSAKDATDAQERLQQLFAKYCKESNVDDQDDNGRIAELLKAATHCMKVSSSSQVVSMFINSERIHHDIGSALKYGKEQFKQNVVIRKWIPIDIDMEFRGFVHKGKLTALSQYNHIVYFQRLSDMKQEIAKKICTFYEQQIKERLKDYEGYIIDFALCGENYDRILVIELNPFMESTDAALFSWQQEREKLENGPFEFRIRDQQPTGKIKIEYKYRVLLGWEH